MRPLSSRQKDQPDDDSYRVALALFRYLRNCFIDTYALPNPSPAWIELTRRCFYMASEPNRGGARYNPAQYNALKKAATAALDEAMPAAEFARSVDDPEAFAPFKKVYPREHLADPTPGRWRNEIKKSIIFRLKSFGRS